MIPCAPRRAALATGVCCQPMIDVPEIFVTQRLRVRPPHVGDAVALIERWVCDEDACRYMLFPRYARGDVTAAGAYLASCVEGWAERNVNRAWCIEERDDPTATPVGMIGIVPGAHNAFEVGYIIGRQWWGRGYAVEATRGLVRRLFDDVRLWRVTATTHADNQPSQRVLAKSGFVHEGTARRYAAFPRLGLEPQTCSMWAITRDELVAAGYRADRG